MAAELNLVRFNPTAGGLTDWTFSTIVAGHMTPTLAGAVNGKLYKVHSFSADQSQWELSEGAYNSATGVFSRTTILYNSSGTGTATGQSGAGTKINFTTVPQCSVVMLKEDSLLIDEANSWSAAQKAQARTNIAAQAQGDFAGMSNGTLVASAAAGALTVAVKTFAGADPSATDPVYFYFRNNTLTAGDFTRIAVTAALSVVLGSTNTLGATSGQGLRVWISAHNNAGTVQLGAINCSDSSGVYCPQEHVKYTTTLPGNSSKIFYSTSAIATAAPWRLLGFCEWNALATAGTWVAPDVVELLSPGAKKPGDVVQTVYATTSSVATNTTNTFVASNLTLNITPISAANMIKVVAVGSIDSATQNNAGACQIHRGATAIGSTSFVYSAAGGEATATAANHALDLPNTTASTTYTVKFKNNGAGGGTIGYPGAGTAVMQAEEIMG